MDKIRVNSKEFLIKLVKTSTFNQVLLNTKISFFSIYFLNSLKRISSDLSDQFLLKNASIKLYDLAGCSFIFNNTFLSHLKMKKYE